MRINQKQALLFEDSDKIDVERKVQTEPKAENKKINKTAEKEKQNCFGRIRKGSIDFFSLNEEDLTVEVY